MRAIPLDPADLGSRVLVIVPHPDDEVIAAGGAIHALTASGAQVSVASLTAGDAYRRACSRLFPRPRDPGAAYLALGELRRAEALAAAAALGVPERAVTCLGYPDGRLAALCADGRSPVAGRTGAREVPYPWALSPGAPYERENVLRDLASIVTNMRPTAVIAPDVADRHADHRAAALLSRAALDEVGFDGPWFTFLVHRGVRGFPWTYRPARPIAPGRRPSGATWRVVTLSPADIAAKERAIAEYASQTAVPDLRRFMRAFVRTTEVFAERTPPDGS